MPNKKLPIIPPLPVPLISQKEDADCLAACAAMVLAYNDQPISYAQLLKLFQITSIGAPRRHILRLTTRGINVTYREANLRILAENYLQGSEPVIAFVDTAELHYWSTVTNHAVVVVGLDEDNVTVLDPVFPDAPQSIPHDEFHLAWLNGDYSCAIIHRA